MPKLVKTVKSLNCMHQHLWCEVFPNCWAYTSSLVFEKTVSLKIDKFFYLHHCLHFLKFKWKQGLGHLEHFSKFWLHLQICGNKTRLCYIIVLYYIMPHQVIYNFEWDHFEKKKTPIKFYKVHEKDLKTTRTIFKSV